ncbi:MAG: hypothetical protein RMY16_12570 [Nostoc sp. DedQUE12b]|uniref:hypothetical protein n=1 Tax=unclassified Nostoc TaxID=2593658 RepID=UPI002AD52199|nr:MULTISPECIES: hypothetical protein [unclassified Nostoc]MDZ7953484.1 hypothetical protein [Nostoc sp. DedQUE09]MDZ8086378.1 hypothetical protein [Nostoc sp. DedQUE12b]
MMLAKPAVGIANSVPLPNSDVSVNCTPCFSIIDREMANHQQVFLLTGFVVKK